MAQLGWVGPGRIGLPMAARLVAAGHDVTVWDSVPERIETARKIGATAATRLADVGAAASVIFLCLSDGAAVEDVVFGPQGLATVAKAGSVIVDHTTIHPDHCRKLAEKALGIYNLGWVDAPISGGPPAASAGKLVTWLGGRADDVKMIQSFISSYCAKINYMGPSGCGLLVKACNQMVVCSTVAAWSEMLRFAARVGLNPRELLHALEGGAADTPVRKGFASQLVDGSFPRISLANMTKDLSIIGQLAHERNLPVPIAKAALLEFEKFISSRVE